MSSSLTTDAPADVLALRVDGLTAGYGRSTVVRDVTLSVRAGEIVALLGRNGVGKTTTLLSVGGFLSRVAGEMELCGEPLTGSAHSRARRGLGSVLEGRSIFPTLSVAKNLSVARVDQDEVLELFPELRARLATPAGMLSGGEQQMLSLARAMARHPRVLLIDELSFGLSPVMCDRLFAGVRSFAQQHSTGVLLVEQHLHYAAAVCDRAFVMNDGELRLEVRADELASRESEIERLYLADVAAAT